MPAGFRYTPPGGSLTTHTLARKLRLREGSIARVKTRYRNISLDQRVVDTVTLEGGAEEVEAVVRTDTDPNSLLTMLDYGADGVVLHYYPDLAGGTSYPLVLVSAGGLVEIKLDRDRFSLNEWEVVVRLRRVDGGSIIGIVT